MGTIPKEMLQPLECKSPSGFTFELNYDIEKHKGHAILQPFVGIKNDELAEEFEAIKGKVFSKRAIALSSGYMLRRIFQIEEVQYAGSYNSAEQLSADLSKYQRAFHDKCTEEYSHIQSYAELYDFLFENEIISGPNRTLFEMFLATKFMTIDDFLKIKHNGSELSQRIEEFFVSHFPDSN